MSDVIDKPRWTMARQKADALTEPFSVPPIPVLEIAEGNGVDVVFAMFDEKVAGFCDFEGARLYVNDRDPINRKTFTIAHEFGHWVLHREFYLKFPDRYPVLPRFSSPSNGDPFEVEANHFAANLLVPYRLLRPVIGAPVSRLAEIFSVSRQMMEIRVQNAQSARQQWWPSA